MSAIEHRDMLLRISNPLAVCFGEIEMLNLLKALRQDEHGVILSAELVIIGSFAGHWIDLRTNLSSEIRERRTAGPRGCL